ncbi:response regulator [Aestuariivirga sp.]|uniref:response regulator n=1 Tax=Aestuariivirga sp. TaxID=2650926 RepID=UPI0039E245D0
METDLSKKLRFEPRHYSVLVLEDEPLIAIDLEHMLRQLGFTTITLVGTVERALATIDAYDLAILDVSLRNGTSAPVAEALRSKGAPFIVSTGYIDTGPIPSALKVQPFLRKPFSIEDLALSLNQLSLP